MITAVTDFYLKKMKSFENNPINVVNVCVYIKIENGINTLVQNYFFELQKSIFRYKCVSDPLCFRHGMKYSVCAGFFFGFCERLQ